MAESNPQYLAPAADEHTSGCRVRLFQWRLRNSGLPIVNDVARFPCVCNEDGGRWRDWRLMAAEHPRWCVVDGQHPWTECTITPMVLKEDE